MVADDATMSPPPQTPVRFGLIGLGLMGREFASAAARWCHLTAGGLRPQVVALCSRHPTPERTAWYARHFPDIQLVTADYRELLASPEVDAVYVAVPHHLHREIYCAALDAGKHLLGEKPFGIDLPACEAILERMAANPGCRVGCASQYLFYPAVQRMLGMIERGEFGRIIAVESEFSHSSDLNPAKPINWKRMIEYNGECGVMGDLGMHIAVVPARAGWAVQDVRAICSNIVPERPDGEGGMAPCETWDNAAVLARLRDPGAGTDFPWTLSVNRIMPGEKNTWRTAIYGTRAGARFSLKNPRRFELFVYENDEQYWRQIDMGFETAYETITGPIFEFGSVDAFMQMMAAFLHELEHGEPRSVSAACPSPQEARWCHRLFAAALESNRTGNTVGG